MTMRATAVLGALALSAASTATATAAPPTVQLDIQTHAQGPLINRDIFGQFAEHLGSGIYGGIWVGKDSPIPNVRGVRSDTVAALRALHVPVVRWPGGCFADQYHWRKGIGPADRRPATVNSDWGGVIEPNSFGTDEFMDFLGQIGAEAYVSVNVGSGSPEEAADWFEYMTSAAPSTLAKERAANGHPAPYRIKYMGIGNENWGCGGAMSPDHYVEEMKRFAHYVHDLNPAQTGDAAIKRIAVGWDGENSDYTDAVMKAWKSKVWSWDIDGVSLHSYTVDGFPPHLPATGFGEDDYAKALKETLGMDALLTHQSAIMDRYDPARKLALAVDEWGMWLAQTPGAPAGSLRQQNSMRDAMVAALNLNIFMRHAERVRMTNIAQMANVLQAMIVTDGPRLMLTPTYHVYRMYAPFQDATLVPVSFDAGTYTHAGATLPRVDAVAARDKAGRLWLALANLDPNAETRIALGAAGLRFASGEVLTAPKVDAVNTFDAPNTVAPRPLKASTQGGRTTVTLPPDSVAVIALDAIR